MDASQKSRRAARVAIWIMGPVLAVTGLVLWRQGSIEIVRDPGTDWAWAEVVDSSLIGVALLTAGLMIIAATLLVVGFVERSPASPAPSAAPSPAQDTTPAPVPASEASV